MKNILKPTVEYSMLKKMIEEVGHNASVFKDLKEFFALISFSGKIIIGLTVHPGWLPQWRKQIRLENQMNRGNDR